MYWKDKSEGVLEGFFFLQWKMLVWQNWNFCWYIWLSLKYLQKMLKYSVLTFLLQPLCYTAILHKCKMKSNWVSPRKQFILNVWTFPSMKKTHDSHFYLWFRTKSNFEALEFSRGWDVWFLAALTFGAVVRWAAMLTMPQRRDRRDAAHGTAWRLCSVLQHPTVAKALFGSIPGKLPFTPL